MKIGKIKINNLIFAPMAGFSDVAARRLAAENGAGLTVTEMVSVKALLYGNEKTELLLRTHNAETTKCVQLFGHDPNEFYRCANLPVLEKFDIIDVNFGCPVKKIVGNGDGSALISNPKLAAQIIAALKKTGKAVTAKTRLGIINKTDVLDFALRLEDAGLDMLTVHARTAKQMYGGEPDFAPLNALKSRLRIPLAANGNITDTNSFNKAAASGADAFMIGRGFFHDPAIFVRLIKPVDNTNIAPSKLELVLKLIDYYVEIYGNKHTAVRLRSILPLFLKGISGGKRLRITLNSCEDANIIKNELCSLSV